MTYKGYNIDDDALPDELPPEKLTPVAIPVSLKIGEYYELAAADSVGTGMRYANYGTWKFEGCASCQLHFTDEKGAALSIPKDRGGILPADGWLAIPKSTFLDI
jgi:hypothetical protein